MSFRDHSASIVRVRVQNSIEVLPKKFHPFPIQKSQVNTFIFFFVEALLTQKRVPGGFHSLGAFFGVGVCKSTCPRSISVRGDISTTAQNFRATVRFGSQFNIKRILPLIFILQNFGSMRSVRAEKRLVEFRDGGLLT